MTKEAASLEQYSRNTTRRSGRPVSFLEVLSITRQLITALSEVHLAGIYHRDLCPHNVLVYLLAFFTLCTSNPSTVFRTFVVLEKEP